MVSAPVKLEIMIMSIPRAATWISADKVSIKIAGSDALPAMLSQRLSDPQIFVTDGAEEPVELLFFVVVVVLSPGPVVGVLLRGTGGFAPSSRTSWCDGGHL
jgi:hypothetical protein